MAKKWQGKVEEVGIYPVGAEVLATAAIGATVITIDSIGSFSEYGGTLTFGDSITKVYYLTVDEDASTITLTAPLAAAVAVETYIFQYPYAEERLASVRSEESEDSIMCRLSSSVSTVLDDGVRDQETMETCIYKIDEDEEYVIIDIPSEAIRYTFDSLPVGLDTVQADLATLNNVTLPALNADLAVANADIATLNNTTIPALNANLAVANADIATLNNTTIPNLNTNLNTAQSQINTLNNTTVPNLQTNLNTANSDIAASNANIASLQGKFPITGTNITDGAISTPKMTANSIEGDRITANTLNASKIVAGSITSDKITANTINGNVITANTLNADKIVAGSITSNLMTANTINGDVITGNTLNAAKIVAGSITSNLMTANTINGDVITGNTLNAAKIVAGSITTDKMTANTINGDVITANSLNADKIVANSITTAKLNALAINGMTITMGASTTSGERIVIRPDAAGGIIEGWTGVTNEQTPAKFNPRVVVGSADIPSLTVACGTSTAYPNNAGWIMRAGTTGNYIQAVGRLDFSGMNCSANSTNIIWSNMTNTAPATGNRNLMLAGNNMYASTNTNSAAKFKTRVKNLNGDPLVLLKLQPRQFKWKQEFLAPGVAQIFELGVIAGEVAALGPEFVPWLVYDQAGEVEGFQYDKWPMALQLIAQHQQSLIKNLTDRITQLENA